MSLTKRTKQLGRRVIRGKETRQAITRSLMRYRVATAGQRRLPDFVIIGAQKAGTSSLYNYLIRHPDILKARRKEVEFFSINYDLGEDWYRAYFPVEARVRAMRTARRRPVVTGEASPYYLFHPLAPERCRRLLPDARLVVLLREPVERAFSHYRFELSRGRETLTFEEALDAEEARLAGEAATIRSGGRGREHQYHSYVARGFYAEQLERWFACYPREQFLILRSEELFERPEAIYRQATAFVGAEAIEPPTFNIINEGRPSNLDPALRARLDALYEDPNRRLEELLGRQLGWAPCR